MLNMNVARLIEIGLVMSRMDIFTEICYTCARSVESFAVA